MDWNSTIFAGRLAAVTRLISKPYRTRSICGEGKSWRPKSSVSEGIHSLGRISVSSLMVAGPVVRVADWLERNTKSDILRKACIGYNHGG
jgi:hypothetical protein